MPPIEDERYNTYSWIQYLNYTYKIFKKKKNTFRSFCILYYIEEEEYEINLSFRYIWEACQAKEETMDEGVV